MTSNDILVDVELNVSVKEAWQLWLDGRKLVQWLTTEARVEPQVGGAYELFWDPTNHNDNSTLGCKITALVPHKLLAFEWRGPVPYADLMNVEPFPTWASVSFEPVEVNKTMLHFRHSGWGVGDPWREAKDWQNTAWTMAFNELANLEKT